MNDPKRIVQIHEQTFRIGRQPAAKSFLDSCDPNGLPRYLRDVDRYVAAQYQFWDWLSPRGRLILFVGLAFGPAILGLVAAMVHLRLHGH